MLMMIKSEPLISVIMPCYNADSFIGEAINSVLNQTYNNIEFIIINDGSTDGSEDVIKSFPDKRIKYLFQENQGQTVASNVGLAHANGEFIKFFDADDIMNDTHLQAQYARIKDSDNTLASCAWGRFYNDDYRSTKFKPETVWKDMRPLEWIKASLHQKYDMMGVCVWLIPKNLIEKTGGWDERLSLNNDFEFSMRLLLESEMVLFAEDAKIFYRSGIENALSQIFKRERVEAAILSNELGCQYLLDKENTHETRLLCANRFQEWLYRIYPEYPDLQNKIEKKIEELGGSDRKMDGGRFFQLLDSLIGWRAAKLVKLRLRKMGYRKLPFN